MRFCDPGPKPFSILRTLLPILYTANLARHPSVTCGRGASRVVHSGPPTGFWLETWLEGPSSGQKPSRFEVRKPFTNNGL